MRSAPPDTARDQAAGLRRLFAERRRRFVALVQNPFVEPAELVIDRLCQGFGALGLHTLVVDAADGAPPPRELALLDLASCIEPMAADVSYLAARGLPIRHVDSHGRCNGFLDLLERAAPQADVVLVHAGTGDLARLFALRPLRPLLQAADSPRSLTEAYAAAKRLAQRPGWLSHDVLLLADPQGPRTARIAESLASCAERFLGAAIHDVAVLDPAAAGGIDALLQLLRAQLAQDGFADPAAHAAQPAQAATALARQAAASH
ncbi:MAG: flagellar biosynthesis protein [Burkholderiaceae bacterium]